EELADVNGERTRAFVSAFCRRHGVNVIAGSIAERREGGVYNTLRLYDRKGEAVLDYDKMHLFRLMEEEKHLQAGGKLGQAEIDGHAAGMMICYDIRFPELSRALALQGAKLLVVPAEWPHPRLH